MQLDQDDCVCVFDSREQKTKFDQMYRLDRCRRILTLRDQRRRRLKSRVLFVRIVFAPVNPVKAMLGMRKKDRGKEGRKNKKVWSRMKCHSFASSQTREFALAITTRTKVLSLIAWHKRELEEKLCTVYTRVRRARGNETLLLHRYRLNRAFCSSRVTDFSQVDISELLCYGYFSFSPIIFSPLSLFTFLYP